MTPIGLLQTSDGDESREPHEFVGVTHSRATPRHPRHPIPRFWFRPTTRTEVTKPLLTGAGSELPRRRLGIEP